MLGRPIPAARRGALADCEADQPQSEPATERVSYGPTEAQAAWVHCELVWRQPAGGR